MNIILIVSLLPLRLGEIWCKSYVQVMSLTTRLTTCSRYFPVMISRMMLSLRKAARSQRDDVTLAQSLFTNNFHSLEFPRAQGCTNGRDDIVLDTYLES